MSDKLSRDEILSMEAGREMDALIVSHIIDLTWWKRGASGQWIALPKNDTEIPTYWTQEAPPRGLTEDDLSEAVPHYSTDIAAAWEVVEKIHGDGQWWCDLSWRDDVCPGRVVWAVDFVTKDGRCESSDDESAPLAICRAALLAVMEEA